MNFLSVSYWFNTQPGALVPGAMKLLSVFLVLLFALAFIAYLRSKNKKDSYRKIWEKVFNFSLANLAIGLILLFFFYENIPFLSMRVLALVWLGIMIYWVCLVWKEAKKIPLRKKERKQEEEYKKYIP
jgi:amino acid transporter